MTAVLLTPLTGQFFDDEGNPLSGGLIYSYVAGTSTPQDTYTDATGTIPAANPVVLDSAGRADIWGSGVYKFIIKDSLGNTIDTVDSVTAIYGSGDMAKAVYDAANIAEQLAGLTATQTLTNKTLTAPVINGATLSGTVGGAATFSGSNFFSVEQINQFSNKVSAGFSVTSSTTLVNVTGLTWSLVSGAKYRIRLFFRTTQLAAGGCKIGIAYTGTTSNYRAIGQIWNSTSLITVGDTGGIGGAIVSSITGISNYGWVESGFNTTSAGTASVQFAQQASNATPSTLDADISYATIERTA